MKVLMSVIVSLVAGYSSVALSCIPSITTEVKHNIINPGGKDLVAYDVGGHVSVNIAIYVAKGSKVEVDSKQLLFANKKIENGTLVYTYQVVGSGSGYMVVSKDGREVANQKVTTKVMPTPKGISRSGC